MYKPDNEERTTSQLSIDPDLSQHLEPGVYTLDAVLEVSCDPAGGFKVGFEGSAEIANNYAPLHCLVLDPNGDGNITFRTVTQSGQLGTEFVGSDYYTLHIKGSVRCTEAGSYGLCWSQVSENAAPTVLARGSYLLLHDADASSPSLESQG